LEVNATGLEVQASDDKEAQPTLPKQRARSSKAAKPRSFGKSTRVLCSSKPDAANDKAFEFDESKDKAEEPPKRCRKSPPAAKKPSINDDDRDADEVCNKWETNSPPARDQVV